MKLTTRLSIMASLVLFSIQVVQAQVPCSQGTKFRGCKACGSATSAKGQKLNLLKNRGTKATNPQKVTVAEIRKRANNTGHFKPTQRVWVTGYVAGLDKGGFKETCNCGREDLRDIHINIVADPSEANDKTKYVVVEITPRWQDKFQLDDSDYEAMLQRVKDQIEHKWVRFEGWMLSDSFHAKESKSTAASNTPTCRDDGNDPRPCVWRATPWEVHPVTSYTVVPGP